MTRILAIDPGKTGAIATLGKDERGCDDLGIKDMPATVPDLFHALKTSPEGEQISLCLIEKQQAMPRQGLSSTFNLARHYGHLEAFCYGHGFPLAHVTPAAWKRKMGLWGKDKNAAREMAQHLFPDWPFFDRVKDHGRAEAALLAVYARRFLL